MALNRREFFAALLAAAAVRRAGAADDAMAIPGKRPMILHNDRPEDLETPVRYFDSWLTPVDAFFVRQHIPRPAPIDGAACRLTVNGMVSKPLEMTLADLQRLPQAHRARHHRMHRQRPRILHAQGSRHPVGPRRHRQRRVERSARRRHA